MAVSFPLALYHLNISIRQFGTYQKNFKRPWLSRIWRYIASVLRVSQARSAIPQLPTLLMNELTDIVPSKI